MIPLFPDFIDFFEVMPAEYVSLVEKYDSYSDFNYVSVYCWSQPNSCFISILNGNLVLSIKEYIGDNQVLTFLGVNEIEKTTQTLLDYAASNTQFKKDLKLVPSIIAHQLAASGSYMIVEDHDNHDYILSAADTMTFPGKRYLKKRNRLNKFQRLYENTYKVFDVDLSNPAERNLLIKLDEKWLRMGTDGASQAENEADAIHNLLDNYSKLSKITKLKCISLRVSGKLTAFIIYEISNKHAVTHFAKSEISILYGGEYLLAELMKRLYQEYGIDEVNIEQDLGIAGLREHKTAHSPSRFLQKYTVSSI